MGFGFLGGSSERSRSMQDLTPSERTIRICHRVQGFIQRGGGGAWNIPPPARFFPPQDFEIQYDVIIIIMYTMDIVQ